MSALQRIVAPTVTPLTLAEVKKHLRVASSDQDDLITIYLKAATDYIDGEWGFLGRAIITQTWRLTLDAFPANNQIRIPLPPLQAVQSVKYDDLNGDEQEIAQSDYFVDTASEPGWVVPIASAWPATINAINAVRVDFIAGYPADVSSPPDQTANVPFNIKAGLLLIIANLMEHREENIADTINKLPFGADILLRRHKIDKSMA